MNIMMNLVHFVYFTHSLTHTQTDYHVAMGQFFETFDSNGWSIWRGDYKYNEECKVLFMTSNLIGGFIQRTEEIRKWLFGTCTIRGAPETGTVCCSFFAQQIIVVNWVCKELLDQFWSSQIH